MTDWQACFSLKAGKRYRVRFVRKTSYLPAVGAQVEEAVLDYKGETMGETAILIPPPGVEVPIGPISIVSIDEITADGRVR